MTIEQMRELVGLPEDATDAEVVAAYAELVDDGIPVSIELVEPVTVDQARKQCRIDDDIEDDLIAQKIRTAREWVEEYTGKIMAQRTLVAHFRTWGSYLEILARPVISIDAVAYEGLDGDAIYTDATGLLGLYPVRLFPGAAGWPALRPAGGITVAYTAGYDAGEVPYPMIEAVLVLVSGMYGDRSGGYDKAIESAKRLVKRRPPNL